MYMTNTEIIMIILDFFVSNSGLLFALVSIYFD